MVMSAKNLRYLTTEIGCTVTEFTRLLAPILVPDCGDANCACYASECSTTFGRRSAEGHISIRCPHRHVLSERWQQQLCERADAIRGRVLQRGMGSLLCNVISRRNRAARRWRIRRRVETHRSVLQRVVATCGRRVADLPLFRNCVCAEEFALLHTIRQRVRVAAQRS